MRPSATESLYRDLEAHYGQDGYFLPRHMLLRPLTVKDVDQVEELEKASYPESEAASRESIQYRLTACSELCVGLFSCEYNWDQPSSNEEDDDREDSVVSKSSTLKKETLIGYILATKTTGEFISDEDMKVGSNKEDGRTIAIHSVVISKEYRDRHFGYIMLKDYIQKFYGLCTADRISIIVLPKLRGFYERHGFTDCGVSECQHGGETWHNMKLPFDTYDE